MVTLPQLGFLGISILTFAACGSGKSSDPCADALFCATGGAGLGGATSGGTPSSGASTSTGGAIAEECPAPPTAPVVPPGTTIDTTVQGGLTVTVRQNHLGYETKQAKRAVVTSSGALASFQVVRSADSQVAFVGSLEAVTFNAFSALESPQNYYVADFSTLRTPGSYALVVNGTKSDTFEIGDNFLAGKLLSSLVGYFKNSRADDTAVWNYDASVPRTGGGAAVNAQGGYYDASGDISKYLTHLSYAYYFNPQQIPLVGWAMAFAKDEAGTLVESLGQTAAIEAEALWAADYLVRVQAPEGYFFTNIFDVWTGTLADRSVCALEGEGGTKTNEYQSAFREGGGMAIAALARVSKWGKAGAFPSSQYLEVAKSAYAHLKTNGASYCDDGKENIIDDYAALLAATELFLATSDASYLADARARASSLRGRLSEIGYFLANEVGRPFWHASDAGLPIVALVRYASAETDATAQAEALSTIKTHTEYLKTVTSEVPNPYGYARQHVNTQGSIRSTFFIPHDNETGYWWQGENARLASLSAAAYQAQRALRPVDCGETDPVTSSYARSQLEWILGENPANVGFVNGIGKNNPPNYCGEKPPYHGTLAGGISNGLTGSATDGSGIQWLSGDANPDNCWKNWRWSEQWLPHSAWMLVAVLSEANAGD